MQNGLLSSPKSPQSSAFCSFGAIFFVLCGRMKVSVTGERMAQLSFENLTQREDSREKVTIYTDGGCKGNPGPGGWGIVVIYKDDVRELSGGEKYTTNNRMELTAAINALTVVKNTPSFEGKKIELFTDSQYVKDGITSWIINWKKHNWMRGENPVKNVDLWKALDELNAAVQPLWIWVKGHAGIEYNEICDQLCQKEIAKF